MGASPDMFLPRMVQAAAQLKLRPLDDLQQVQRSFTEVAASTSL
jgi:hypothetical protein